MDIFKSLYIYIYMQDIMNAQGMPNVETEYFTVKYQEMQDFFFV